MLARLTTATRSALVLFVMLIAAVAVLIGTTHHAASGGESAESVLLVETMTAHTDAGTDSASEVVGSWSDTTTMALACALLVICCVALLARALRVARRAAILSLIGALRVSEPAFSLILALPSAPSLRLLSISRT